MRGSFLYFAGLVAALAAGVVLGQSGMLETKVRAKTDRFALGLVPETVAVKAAKDQSRLPEYTCPPGQRVTLGASGEIGCK